MALSSPLEASTPLGTSSTPPSSAPPQTATSPPPPPSGLHHASDTPHPWLEVRFVLPTDAAERLAETLLNCGALSCTLEDADAGTEAERPQYAEPGEAVRLWDRCRVVALFDADAPWEAQLGQAARAAKVVLPHALEVLPVPADDWVRRTQSEFAPIAIADGALWIVPSWHEPPSEAQVVLRLDPGLAFGTGSHATTALCLEWLVQHVRAGMRVLDYGCGSGILAIATAKLGAERVVAIDIDPAALTATRDNAAANGVAARIDVRSGHEPLVETFDLVVANILTRPLIVLAPVIAQAVAPGGRLALTGILQEQAEEVIAAYAPYVALAAGAQRDGWVRLEGVRHTTGTPAQG